MAINSIFSTQILAISIDIRTHFDDKSTENYYDTKTAAHTGFYDIYSEFQYWTCGIQVEAICRCIANRWVSGWAPRSHEYGIRIDCIQQWSNLILLWVAVNKTSCIALFIYAMRFRHDHFLIHLVFSALNAVSHECVVAMRVRICRYSSNTFQIWTKIFFSFRKIHLN